MISAKEARIRLEANKSLSREVILKDLETKINEAIKEEKDFCQWYYDFDEEVISTMIDLGYTLTEIDLAGELAYRISW